MKKSHEFKIGDLIIVVSTPYQNPGCGLLGRLGRVAAIGLAQELGVEFSSVSDTDGLHNLGGMIVSRKGWWIPSRNCKPALPLKEALEKFFST